MIESESFWNPEMAYIAVTSFQLPFQRRRLGSKPPQNLLMKMHEFYLHENRKIISISIVRALKQRFGATQKCPF